MTNKRIRQPIVTVCGHVDHGKTSILDALRGSSVTETEAGGITQKISFTSYPSEQLNKSFPLIEKSGIKLEIPGFLFIDTPGHAAFTNLRKRGGSLADLAVLVIDINEGIKPQTAEVIQILKLNKTPFIIALNKVDRISGWKFYENRNAQKNIEAQPVNSKQEFEEKLYTIIGALNSYGFDADLFFNISDFTKKIAMVPCSAKTKQGLQELMLMLCGLSQKYLERGLILGKRARGVVLEIKKEKALSYIEAILYDGELKKGDEIAIANLQPGSFNLAKIRVLEEILPLSSKFSPKEEVLASTGIRLQMAEKTEIIPGMPFVIYEGDEKEIREEFNEEISENVTSSLSPNGVIAKAESLGSLEALLIMLRQENIPVLKAGIGDINKADIANAKANLKINEIDAVILGFNVSLDEEASSLISGEEKIKIIEEEVIYKLIENLVEFRDAKRKEIEKERLLGLSTLCKMKILHQYVFRNTKPAIFGVRIEAGKAISGLSLIDETGEKLGKIKNIQLEKSSVQEATEGMEVAISIPGANFEREIKNKQFLYSDISEGQFKTFRKNKDLLNRNELSILQEIAQIKRFNI
ncbi:MAG TPA: translation initiation factor IF-2 [Patescibacteria group bacterium]|nr:translation initiation factor IF-2 [Patescibacteria group bacterium]